MTDTPASALDNHPAAEATIDLARDVRATLLARPRSLSPRHLYDPLGSALFDAICRLPWYRITRAEIGLLRRHAAEILSGAPGAAPGELRDRPRAVGPAADVVELGPGNGDKLLALLTASPLDSPTAVHLIDISPAALVDASHKLQGVPNVTVTTHATRYVQGLESLRDSSPEAHRLVLFLGSNIGNSEPDAADELLAEFRAALAPGDTLLLGTDLVKPEEALLLAYDDPLGVTAAFSRNVLVRLNRDLDATFDIEAFRHHARWNASASRIEIHLVSLREQHIRVPGADFEFTMAEGESIWTESSYKYEPDGVRGLLSRAGLRTRAQWVDEEARFALTLAGAD